VKSKCDGAGSIEVTRFWGVRSCDLHRSRVEVLPRRSRCPRAPRREKAFPKRDPAYRTASMLGDGAAPSEVAF
jgi:hypothetical protein